jgi:hypothetical protein
MDDSPVFVVITNRSKYLDEISIHNREFWDKVIIEMRKIKPDLRYSIVFNNDSKDFGTIYPLELAQYNMWDPMGLLIPGCLWNSALATIGKEHPTPLADGVKIMNGNKYDGYVYNSNLYRPGDIFEYSRWLLNALHSEEFICIQYSPIPIGPSAGIGETRSLGTTGPVGPSLNVEERKSSGSIGPKGTSEALKIIPCTKQIKSNEAITRKDLIKDNNQLRINIKNIGDIHNEININFDNEKVIIAKKNIIITISQ